MKLTTLLDSALLPTLGLIAPRAPQRHPVQGTSILELDGGYFHYQSTGAGDEAVLLLHGFNSQLSVWDTAWPHLADCGRRIRLDIAGYGGSEWRTGSYSLPIQAQRVISFIDALGVVRVTLVGVSMGGSLAAWIAARYPERVKGLLLLAPSAYPGALRYRGPFGRLLGPGILNRLATRVADTEIYRRRYPTSSALHALTVTASYGEPWAHALADIRAHAWLLWSRGDETVPFSYAEAVASSIPTSTLVPLCRQVGHDIPNNRPHLIGRLACRIHRGSAPAHILRELQDVVNREGDA